MNKLKLLLFTLLLNHWSFSANDNIIIPYTVSDYNLLFTDVQIQGKTFKALIDFGDFAELQLSTTLIKELNLETVKTDIVVSNVYGDQFALDKGSLNVLKIGENEFEGLTFYSALNEIEAVSEEVGTPFHVVLGFGFFKNKNFVLDGANNTIEFLSKPEKQKGYEVSINTDWGYLIANFTSASNDTIPLMIDTGSPTSMIDSSKINSSLKDSLIYFMGVDFPSKIVPFSSSKNQLMLNMELGNLMELYDLGAFGILGMNDIKDMKIYYFEEEKKIIISK